MDDQGLAELRRESRLGAKERQLAIARRVVPVVVEARLAHGDRVRVRKQASELPDVVIAAFAGLMRVDAETRADAGLRGRDVERDPARLEPGADRDDLVDARGTRTRHQLGRRLGARVEVRVGVDHSVASGDSTRGKRGAAGSTDTPLWLRPQATSAQERSGRWPSASRIRGAVSGR